jgi:hypothetical protein
MSAALLGLMLAVAVLVSAGIVALRHLLASLRELRAEASEWGSRSTHRGGRDFGPPE